MAVYNYNDSIQLTPHFNTREFKCHCGRNHSINIDDRLPNMLERLYEKLDCSKIIINSGHRCEYWDVYVGGNGGGQHVYGKAADINCYDKNGNVINTKRVACVAQDLGFGGIGNIDGTYTAIHVDVRTSNIWYGDEAVPGGTAHSITNSYYNYYGIEKSVDNKTAEKSTDKTSDKTVDDLAKEVMAGKWGNGADRKNRLTQAGYNYEAVQSVVNSLCIDAVARDVIAGKYGNGAKRREQLEAAGYNYQTVQNRVNELLK